MSKFQKSTLSNGIRVMTERHSDSRAVLVGIWLLTGSRDEAKGLEGVSHFLEHFVFKGTKNRTGYQIALALEAVGGELNAFTTKEYICFHTTSLQEHTELSVDVLADLVSNSTLPKAEFEREKGVILQEIQMSAEEYSEYIYDYYIEKAFGRHPAGHPILGTTKSIEEMSLKDIAGEYKDRLFGDNIMVTAVGNVDHDQVVKLVDEKLKSIKKKGRKVIRRKPKAKKIRKVVKSPSEQIHILMGMPTASYKDALRFESYLVSTMLGGGMTSKVYQSVREKRGLAYSTYAYLYTFVDSAMSFLYAGTDKSQYKKATALMIKELEKLKKGISKKDLELFRTQIKGTILLSAEDLESRMTSLAHNEMIFKKHRSTDEIIKEIDAISVESVNRYINEYIDLDQLGIVALGDLDPKAEQAWIESL